MSLYQQGSHGKKVKQIQNRLKNLGFYEGAIDGIYGPGTEGAVKAFQHSENIVIDGIVGPTTWDYLFEDENEKESTILDKPLDYRSLALTGSFETGTPIPACFGVVSGDFDGQGISFGALQWNLGQGTLQPMFETMNEQYPDEMKDIFNGHLSELQQMLQSPRKEQLEWARSIQNLINYTIDEPWKSYFKQLGQCEDFQKLEVEVANQLYNEAVEMAKEYGLTSSRAIALMFDIKVQNGIISDFTEQQIRNEFDRLPESEGETARMCIIANLRAEASNPSWIKDVRTRKLTIATGRGVVHGLHYVLNEEYGITL